GWGRHGRRRGIGLVDSVHRALTCMRGSQPSGREEGDREKGEKWLHVEQAPAPDRPGARVTAATLKNLCEKAACARSQGRNARAARPSLALTTPIAMRLHPALSRGELAPPGRK
ncbi:MAG TPA: hypothetical protein VHH36_09315, partial [Candidatus Thermoplasmatota archaeon]|nr:hypothetical protein [Candidatus Thermoplasmatota archaeon]